MKAENPERGPRASASFRWIDAESREELQVEVRGCEEFFAQLVHLGFERLDGARQLPDAEGADAEGPQAEGTGVEGAEHGGTAPRREHDGRRRVTVNATPARREQRVRRGA